MIDVDIVSSPLWEFAVERYRRPGVREACLALQDEAGVDVALLFACLWLAARGTPAAEARPAIQRALEGTRALRGEVLAPVRSARRRLKTLGGLPGAAEDVRDLIKRAELAVESLYVAELHASLARLPSSSAPSPPRWVFGVYLELEGLALSAEAEQCFASIAGVD